MLQSLLNSMNLEKLVNSFLAGMPTAKKHEYLLKFDESLEIARQTAEDFAMIKSQNTEILSMLQSQIQTIADDAEVAATESAIAADNTDELLDTAETENVPRETGE